MHGSPWDGEIDFAGILGVYGGWEKEGLGVVRMGGRMLGETLELEEISGARQKPSALETPWNRGSGANKDSL